MKKFFRNNRIAFLSFFLLSLWGIWCGFEGKKFVDQYQKSFSQTLEKCQSGEVSELEKERVCPEFRGATEVRKPSTGFVFFWILINTSLYLLQFIGPLFIIIPSCYHFYREYHSGMFRNSLSREKYPTYLRKKLLNSYKNIWIFPAFLLVIFFVSYLISGHFDGADTMNSVFYTYRAAEANHIIYFFPFFFLYVWNLTMLSVLFVSISLIWIRKSINFVVHILLSIITFFGLQIFLQGIITPIYEVIFNVPYGELIFNLNQCWGYEMAIPLYKELTIFIFLLAICSIVLVMWVYHSKEKVILDGEKKMG